MLLFKLLITPLLMGAATLVTRRWGPVIGGTFASLPLTAAPVSVFLYLEQGTDFAVNAACASMLGYAALAFFIVVFVQVPRWMGERPGLQGLRAWRVWLAPCLLSALTYFLFAWLFSWLPRSGLLCLLVAALCLGLALVWIPRYARGEASAQIRKGSRAAWWDLPCRMLAAGGLVLGITGIAAHIGPQWSGFLSTYPVFITLMGIFALMQAGLANLCMLMRGFVNGMFGALAFFFVLQWLLPYGQPLLAYGLAALVNIVVCGADIWLSSHSLRALQRHLRKRRHSHGKHKS